MKAGKIDKPNKVYVVTQKTSSGSSGTTLGNKGAKGGKLKFVDKRMKCERRADRKNAKKGKGRKGR